MQNDLSISEIAEILGISPRSYNLLRQALTHRSYLGESVDTQSNERLEFLGDSVLGLIITEHLFLSYPNRPEGELAKAKAVAVSEPYLGEAAKEIGIDKYLYVSSGEETSGGRQRLSMLSDAFEAVVAVIYFDKGLDGAKDFVLNSLKDILAEIEENRHLRDYKTNLQEIIQATYKIAPQYVVIEEQGLDHDKTFSVEARLNDKAIGCGKGKSKKQAEQAAASQALDLLKKVSPEC